MFRKIKKWLMITLSFFLLGLQIQVVQAEGSKDLTEHGGYRPYTERYGASTAGIDREQRIYVYANQGETLLFGSSVYNASTKYDIRVTAVTSDTLRTAHEEAIPYQGDFKETYDVIENGRGHISSREKEVAGPRYANHPSGYEPLQFTAPQDGVYIFRFYSTGLTTENPITVPVDSLAQGSAINNQQKRGTVACWDVSVLSGNQIKDGRTWTYTLCLNMGSNRDQKGTLQSQVYVLTEDGYTYLTDFNGMDPYGFIFFANSRGLIDLTTNTSLYKSVKDPKNDNAIRNLGDVGVGFHNPRDLDTEIDKTHKIFFHKPADDLPSSIRKSQATPEVQDVYFQAENAVRGSGDVGSGGYFYIKGTQLSSFTIDLDFSTRTNDQGAALPSNQLKARSLHVSFQENTNLGTEWTRVYWDGKDGAGQIVPYGHYGDVTSPYIKITPKAGEFHFPMLDIENNPDGIKIINQEDSGATIYYDNHEVDTLKGLSSYDNTTNGVDSRNGALKFDHRKGDMVAIDVWTYRKGTTYTAVQQQAQLTLKDAVTLQVQKVWDDHDNNDGVRPDAITVQLYKDGNPLPGAENRVILQEANNWLYTWKLEPQGGTSIDLEQYDVKEVMIGDDPVTQDATKDYAVSYDVEKNQIENENGTTFESNKTVTITNTHTDQTKSMQVEKIWKDDDDADGLRPSRVQVVLMANHAPLLDSSQGIDDYVTRTLEKDNGWKASVDGLPIYQNGSAISYEFVEQEEVSEYVTTAKTEQNKTVLTNTHTPKKTSIKVEKRWNDEQNAARKRPKTLELTLYKNDQPTTTIRVSADEDWTYVCDDLNLNEKGQPISYRFVEETIPQGYEIENVVTNEQTTIITNRMITNQEDTNPKDPDQQTPGNVTPPNDEKPQHITPSDNNTTDKNVHTVTSGDTTKVTALLLICVIAGGVIIVMMIMRKRTRNKK